MQQLATSESQIQKDILKYAKLKKLCVFRMNTGGNLRATSRGVIMTPNKNRGFSDLLWLHNGKTYFVEVKTSTGKWSPDQQDFCKLVTSYGGIYFLCRSLDMFIDFVKQVIGA